jgi:hypothetical protein
MKMPLSGSTRVALTILVPPHHLELISESSRVRSIPGARVVALHARSHGARWQEDGGTASAAVGPAKRIPEKKPSTESVEQQNS